MENSMDNLQSQKEAPSLGQVKKVASNELIKSIIDPALENYIGKGISPERVSLTLGLLPGEILTDEQLLPIKTIVQHVGKRILHMQLQDVIKDNMSEDEIKKQVDEVLRFSKNFGLHDIVHGLISHQVNKKSENPDKQNSYIPEFMVISEPLNERVLLEELQPDVFSDWKEELPSVFVCLSNPVLKEKLLNSILNGKERNELDGTTAEIVSIMEAIDCSNYNDVILAHSKVTHLFSQELIERDFVGEGKYYKSVEEIRTKMAPLHNKFEAQLKSRLNQSDKTTDSLSLEHMLLDEYLSQTKRVFDNYPNNHLVIYDEFLKLGDDLLKRKMS